MCVFECCMVFSDLIDDQEFEPIQIEKDKNTNEVNNNEDKNKEEICK